MSSSDRAVQDNHPHEIERQNSVDPSKKSAADKTNPASARPIAERVLNEQRELLVERASQQIGASESEISAAGSRMRMPERQNSIQKSASVAREQDTGFSYQRSTSRTSDVELTLKKMREEMEAGVERIGNCN